MITMVRRCICAVVAAGLLLVAAFWFRWRLACHTPGSLENTFSRVQIGITQGEAVALLRIYNANQIGIDSITASGATKDGRTFYKFTFDDLPPPGEIDHCTLTVLATDGREIEVDLGPGGNATAKHFEPDWWEGMLHSGRYCWEEMLYRGRHLLGL